MIQISLKLFHGAPSYTAEPKTNTQAHEDTAARPHGAEQQRRITAGERLLRTGATVGRDRHFL